MAVSTVPQDLYLKPGSQAQMYDHTLNTMKAPLSILDEQLKFHSSGLPCHHNQFRESLGPPISTINHCQ